MGQALGFRRLPRGPPRVSAKGESVLGVDVQGVTENIAAINNEMCRSIPAAASLTKRSAAHNKNRKKESHRALLLIHTLEGGVTYARRRLNMPSRTNPPPRNERVAGSGVSSTPFLTPEIVAIPPFSETVTLISFLQLNTLTPAKKASW